MLINLLATFLRFSHFIPVQTKVEFTDPVTNKSTTTTQEIRVSFMYVVTTIIVLPFLFALFIIIEFKIHKEKIGKYFNFL